MKRIHLKTPQWILIGLLLAYVGFALYYIWISSFVAGGERYFILNDDAMISMRYAHNLARGFGLRWNPGEAPVEGFSNPLWVLYMAFWHLFPISLSKMSLPIQLTGAALLAANLVFVYRIARKVSGNEWVSLLAVALTGLYAPLNNWGLLGMEVSLLVLLVNIAVWHTLRTLENGAFSWTPYVALGIGTLVRVDAAVPFIVLWGALLYFDKGHRRQHVLLGLSTLLVTLGGQTLLRLWYYGAPLPNTYYLKVTGIPLFVRVANGFFAFAMLVWNSGWLLALLPFAILLYRRDRQVVTLLLVFVAQVAYSIYVGGDAWEHKGGSNRYVSLAIPIFFTLLLVVAEKIVQDLSRSLNETRWVSPKRATAVLLICFTAFSLVQFNSTQDTSFLLTCSPCKALVTTRAGFVQDNIEFREGNKEYVHIVQALEPLMDDEASIAVVTAGVIPYLTDNPAIDLLGKNDAVIAHLDSHLPQAPLARLTTYRPGHSKWDYAYSIGELRPDVIVQLWDDADEAQAYMQDYVVVQSGDYTFSVLKDSPHIHWDAVTIID